MQKHLDELRNALYQNNWFILTQQQGNDYDVSAIWQIAHHYVPTQSLTVVFNGLDDLNVLPIEQSYGCQIAENGALQLYFGKNNMVVWRQDLQNFIKQLTDFILQPSL